MGKPKRKTIKCGHCDIETVFLDSVPTCGNVKVTIGLHSNVFAPRTKADDVEAWLNAKKIGQALCRKGLAVSIAQKLADFL